MHPHGFCLLWDGPLVGTHVLADLAIAMSYFMIPVVLWGVRSLFNWQVARTLLALFGVFIVSCGMTHVMDIVVLWYPLYWLQAVVKAVTAAASLGTLYFLLRLIRAPLALAQVLYHRRVGDV